eukprot:1062620-Pleurochrysis_carterae.AAC.1
MPLRVRGARLCARASRFRPCARPFAHAGLFGAVAVTCSRSSVRIRLRVRRPFVPPADSNSLPAVPSRGTPPPASRRSRRRCPRSPRAVRRRWRA